MSSAASTASSRASSSLPSGVVLLDACAAEKKNCAWLGAMSVARWPAFLQCHAAGKGCAARLRFGRWPRCSVREGGGPLPLGHSTPGRDVATVWHTPIAAATADVAWGGQSGLH